MVIKNVFSILEAFFDTSKPKRKRAKTTKKKTTKTKKKTAKKTAKRAVKKAVKKAVKAVKKTAKKITKKVTKKTTKKAAKTTVKKVAKEEPKVSAKHIGQVSHYFSKIGVCVVDVKHKPLRVGDTIRFKGKDTFFQQKVNSMQIDGKSVRLARKGTQVGLKVNKAASVGDDVLFV